MAKSPSLADSLGKHLECAVCLEQYTEPKVLPCLHSFCKRCLQGLLIQKGAVFKINCPTCRSSAEILQGKIDSLPVNFFVNNLLSTVALHKDSDAGELGCDNCDSEEPPVSRCATCSLLLCDFCNEAHRRGRSTRSHSLMSLEEAKKMSRNKAITKPAICKEHEGEVIKLFCETCEEAICRDCTIVKHRDHNYTFVKDAFSKGKTSLLKILSETKTTATVLKEAVDGVLEMKSKVHSCAEQTVREVVDCFKELAACLDARQREMIGKVEGFKKTKLQSLENQQEKLKTALANVQSSVEFTEKAFENGNEVEILNMRKKMSSRLQDLNSAKWQLEPCVNEGLKFKGDGQLKHAFATFGDVTDVVTNAGMSTVTMGNRQEGVMYNTLCGQPVEFKIIAKEQNGKKRNEGGDVFMVQLNENIPLFYVLKVRDNENGTYSFSYIPVKEGHYMLSVYLNSHHVQGSPFQWCVEKWNLQPFFLDNSQDQLELTEENLTAHYNEDYGLWQDYHDERVYMLDDGLDRGDDDDHHHDYDDWRDYDDEDDDDDGEWQDCDDDGDDDDYDDDDYVDDDDDDYVDDDDDDYVDDDDDGQNNGDWPDYGYQADLLRRRYAVGSDGFTNGKHMWKVQIHGNILQGFSFGIMNTNRKRNGKLVKCGSEWMWNAKQKQCTLQTGVQTAVASNITDCASGDVIELYLDFEDRKLRMYNPRTQQSDTWKGVKGEVTPVFQMATHGDKVSLKIPQKV